MTDRIRANLSRWGALLLVLVILSGCAAREHHRAGLQALEREDYAAAMASFRKAAELAPTDVEYQQNWLRQRERASVKLLARADAALAQGRTAEAEADYRTILSYEREHARARGGLERILQNSRAAEDAAEARKALKGGDASRALMWATRALERDADQAEARAVMRELETLQAKDMLSVPTLASLYRKPINLEFRDASVKAVFEALSRTTGINFIFDRDVKSDLKTTVFLKRTTLEDSIDVILATNQLDKKILNASSVLIYPNTPAKVKEYQDLVVKAVYVAHVEAKQTAAMLKSVLKLKDVFVDERYNMLVLRESPETVALAERLVALHDLQEPEVMLEVAVMEVNRSNLLNLGVQFTDQYTITPLGGTTTAGSTTGTTTTTFKLDDLRHLNSTKLGITAPSATINLQQRDGDAKLLANPSLRVRDREKAKVMIGDKVPVVTTTSTSNGFLAENIQYLDVGLKLEVEPTVRLHDEVGLKISLDVSSVVSSTKTNNGSQAYQIGTRNYSSVLKLRDGETQVIAGLISDEDRSTASRIPLIGSLPILGRLFSSQSDTRQKTEVIMSITPRLIRNFQRKDPSAETFWSGTEATLRSRPLQLRTADPAPTAGDTGTRPPPGSGATGGTSSSMVGAPAASASRSAPGSGGDAVATVEDPNAPVARWSGPTRGQVGQALTLELNLDTPLPLRAIPLQIRYDPAQIDVVNVTEGTFFAKSGKSTFGQSVDAAAGRISVSASVNEAAGVSSSGSVVRLEIRPRVADPEVEISVVGMSPIGGGRAVSRPRLPVSHRLEVGARP